MLARPDLRAKLNSWLHGPLLLPISVLWLVVICWLAFFNGLGSLGLMDKTEALFVEVGRQMHERGEWITPWWNGRTFFDYPVWGYWMVALSFRLFGISAWAARFPAALAASAVVIASFLLLWWLAPETESRLRRWSRAALAAGVLATTPAWIGWGRTATTDIFLSSSVALTLMAFLLARSRQGFAAALARCAIALFAGIAVLAKGPVGLLLPVLVIAVFLTLQGEWRFWLRPLRIAAMALLFLGVALPWYAAAAQRHGDAFLGGFLAFSNVQRFTTVIYDHPGPPWFYLPWLLLLLLPWSFFLPQSLGRVRLPCLGSRSGCAETQADAVSLLLLLWLLIVVGFFSAAATKLPGYILPAIPAASMLICLWFMPLQAVAPTGRAARWSATSEAALLVLLAFAAALAPRWATNDPAYPQLAQSLEQSGLPIRLALLLGVMAVALALLLRSRHSDLVWAPNLFGFLTILALVVAPLAPLLDRERQLPLRELAREAARQARHAEPLWVVGTKRYSALFYSGETASFVSDRAEIDQTLSRDPALLGLTPASRTVRLYGDGATLAELRLPAAQITRLARRNQQELWRVPLAALMAPQASAASPLPGSAD